MPLPIPNPTPDEIAILAEILMLSPDEVVTVVSFDEDQEISNAKWARTLTDIARWDTIKDEANDIKRVGNIEFFEGVNITFMRNFQNNLRRRYGLADLTFSIETSGTSFSCLEIVY